MHLELESCDEEMTIDEVGSNVWNEVKLESGNELRENHGLVEEVISISEDNTINCYRHFVTNKIIDLTVRETNHYAEQYSQTHEIIRQWKFRQSRPTNDEEMLQFFGIIIERVLVQTPKVKYY